MAFSSKEKTEIIMKHYSKPINKVEKLDKNIKQVYLHSSSCVDEIFLHLEIKSKKIVDGKFEGVGCAVCLSSSDIFLEEIKNKTIEEAKTIALNYHNLINQEKFDEDKVGKLVIFSNVKTHLNRLNCASLIEEAFQKFIAEI